MPSAREQEPSAWGAGLAEALRRAPWWLLLVPLFLLGPIVLSGQRFLPQLPLGQEPLRSEHPAEALASDEALHYSASDRIFPALTDQLAMGEAVARGGLPTWEPNLGLGIPLYAQSVAGPTYPPNWLAWLLAPEGLAGPLAGLSLLLAGLGAWLFFRRLGLAGPACVLGALAYQLGGWGIANLYLYMKVDAALYLPWCLWALEGLAQGKRHAGAWLSVCLALSLLAGFLPIGVFVCAASALYALVRLTPLQQLILRSKDRASEAAKRTALWSALGFGLLGVAGSAVAMWPLLEVSGQSERQEQSIEQLAAQGLPNSTLMGIPLLDLFGTPREGTPSGALPVAWWLTPKEESSAALNANALEWNTYAGACVLVLALVGLIATPRRAALPACLLTLTLGFALAWTPLRGLYALPGLDAGAPGRALSLAWFLWPWLAALGLDAILRLERRAMISLVLLSSCLVLGAFALWLNVEPRLWTERLEAMLVRRYEVNQSVEDVRQRLSEGSSLAAAARLRSSAVLCGSMGLALFWCAALAKLRPSKSGPTICAWMLIACVLVEGLVGSREHLVGQSAEQELFPGSASIEAVRSAAGEGRVLRYDPSGVGDVVRLARPNMLQPYGIADLTPWVVFPPKRHNDLFAAYDPAARYNQGYARLSDPALLANPILDLFGVSCVLSSGPLQHARLEPVLERPGFHVYRRTGALGRARLVSQAQVAESDEAALAQLSSAAHRPAQLTLLAPEHRAEAGALGGPGQDPGRLTQLSRPTKSSVELRVEGSQGGFLVLHEQHYPGWSATLNGQPAEILRADHAYQALRLEPGINEIEFKYRPHSVQLGLLLSLGALALALVLSWRLSARLSDGS